MGSEVFSFSCPLSFLQVKSLPAIDLHGVSWHQHKHILAFISGPNHVTIRDYEDSGQLILELIGHGWLLLSTLYALSKSQ